MGAKFGSYGVREAGRSDGFNDDRKEDVGARLAAMIAKNMADQKFIVGFNGADKSGFLEVEASEVVEEGSHWKVTGSKGTLWVSKEAFLYAYPAVMMKR
jgi:hypothetical protein